MKESPTTTDSALSVVIPTKDRPEDLSRCISALKGHMDSIEEIIIINNGTKPIPHSLENARTRVLNVTSENLTRLFNLGWRTSKSRFVAYLNDDSEPQRDWARNVQDTFARYPNAFAVGGPTIDVRPRQIRSLQLQSAQSVVVRVFKGIYERTLLQDGLGKIGKMSRFGAYSIGAWLESSSLLSRPVEVDHLTITNVAFRKEIFEKVGDFDENYQFNHADGDFFVRARRIGLTLVFSPGCAVIHHVNPYGPVRSAYSIGRDTTYFISKNFPPRNFEDVPPFIMMMSFLSAFFIAKTIQSHSVLPIKALSGMVDGFATAFQTKLK